MILLSTLPDGASVLSVVSGLVLVLPRSIARHLYFFVRMVSSSFFSVRNLGGSREVFHCLCCFLSVYRVFFWGGIIIAHLPIDFLWRSVLYCWGYSFSVLYRWAVLFVSF